jgi:hypothetical protein
MYLDQLATADVVVALCKHQPDWIEEEALYGPFIW